MPSQALEEDAATIFRIMEMRAYARAKAMVEQPDTDEDALLKAGLSQDSIDMVMDNKKAALHDKRA